MQKFSLKYTFIFSLAFVTLTVKAQTFSETCVSNNLNSLSFSHSIQARENSSGQITLVTWNAHKFADEQFFYDLKRLAETSDILMVQEAMHSGAWQAAFVSHFTMSFNFFKSFCNGDEKATGVMTAARSLLQNNQTLVSPYTEPISFTPKVSGYSQVLINNQIVHLINTHALNFNIGTDFEAQIDEITNFIANLKGPVIWAGDFNTWNPIRKTYLNEKTKSLGLQHLKPSTDHRALVLDHIYARGFTASKIEILKEKTSDHYPMRAVLKLN